MRVPIPTLILDYNNFFGVEPPDDRISLIKHIPKYHILFEIVALNYRLKPKNKIYVDTSFETQTKELELFSMTKERYSFYSNIAASYRKSKTDYPIIFNRQACLFAIEEIISSDEMYTAEDFNMGRIEVWESILKYLLAVNYTITQIKEEKDGNNISFESQNPKIIPLNELSIETDPIFTFNRGYWLIDYFLNRPDYSLELKSYFKEIYGIEPHHFIFHLMRMIIANQNSNPDFDFFYQVPYGEQDIFDILSIRTPLKETYKLINIRKSPFINVGKLKYILSDCSLLFEKSYSQLLNDFWFDWLQNIKDGDEKPKYTIAHYRGAFGYFFEQYLSKMLRSSFENYRYSILLMFDQLEVNTSKGKVEIADVYLRNGNKILLGQVKSGSIYDTEKFGGDVESLYKKERDGFFKNFGVNQIVDSLIRMDSNIQELDTKFPKGHSYEVFPCIFVNDNALQTPLMPNTFNKRFQELLMDFNIKKVKINPLTIIHINDIERLEVLLHNKPKEIWELLHYNSQEKGFIFPFYNKINRKWTDRNYPDKILALLVSLAEKYNPEMTNN